MTKVTMPEPVGYQWLDTGHFRKKVPADADASAFRALITTPQAEAYADARVREALEIAAKICDDRAIKNEEAVSADEPDEASSLRAAAWQMDVCARNIRALIPPTE